MLNVDKNTESQTANNRLIPLCLGVAILFAASVQQLGAADANDVRKKIEDLSAPNEMTRVFACQSLASVNAKDEGTAVDALIGALGDLSGSVRLAAVTAMGKIGPGAKKAIPNIIECYQRDTVDKATVIRILGSIGSDSTEAIEFLIEVVRGGKGDVVRPLDSKKPPKAVRQEAIVTLGKIGPKAQKCIPILLNIVNITAIDIAHNEQIFQATVDALSIIGVGDKRVMSALKPFQQGKGFPAKSKGSQAFDHAIISADSAVKRLEQSEPATIAEPKNNMPVSRDLKNAN